MTATRPPAPWRENLETGAVAIAMALLLKVFAVEVYKIPSGSMQPTLMGLSYPSMNVYDRIIVDKLSYQLRDPRRWEVAVFRYPLNQSKSYIKRVIGMPEESLRCIGGDLWRREGPDEGDGSILRKPAAIQEDLWLETSSWDWAGSATHPREWQPETGVWRASDEGWQVSGPSALAYRHTVMNGTTDGYPQGLREKGLRLPGRVTPARDIRLSVGVRPEPDCSGIRLDLGADAETFTALVAGPAARGTSTLRRGGEVLWEGDLALPSGEETVVSFGHVDLALVLALDGDEVARVDLTAAPRSGPRTNRASFGLMGGSALVTGTTIHRDLSWTDVGRFENGAWVDVPAGSYFMLGDNSINSDDGRLWRMRTYRLSGSAEGATSIEGHDQPHGHDLAERNPLFLDRHPELSRLAAGAEVVMRDTLGETHRFARADIEPGGTGPVPASFVPREHMLGRALFVFWPWPPFAPAARLKCIR